MIFEVLDYKIAIEKKALDKKNTQEMPDDLKKAIETLQKYGKTLPPSPKKIESAKRATAIKAERAKEKVLNAFKELKEEGGKITIYKVAKRADVSYMTAKKYLEEQGV